MRKVTLLLIASLAMVFSTAFAKTNQAVGAKKMRLSASVGWTMSSPEEGDSTHSIDLMGKGPTITGILVGGPGGTAFTFLDSQVSGLSFAYGINDEMHVALSLPVFNMLSMGDYSANTLFGAAQLGFVFSKAMGSFDLTANAYVNSPFLEMYSGDSEADDFNFDQPLGFGLSIAVDSPEASKLIWGVWMGLSKYLEKTQTTETAGFKVETTYGGSLLLNFVGIIGYKIDPKMSAKLHVYYDVPDLSNDADDAPGFGDAHLSLKGVFDMKLAPNMGISAGLWYRMGLSDEAGLKDVTNLGLSVGYNMTF